MKKEEEERGKTLPEGQTLNSTLRRGWYWGSQQFREELINRLDEAQKMIYVNPMSIAEILEELPKLQSEERHLLFERLEVLEEGEGQETPEMLAAIDAGRQSLREGKTYTPNEARALVKQWATRSS